jgi:hypothetical protein
MFTNLVQIMCLGLRKFSSNAYLSILCLSEGKNVLCGWRPCVNFYTSLIVDKTCAHPLKYFAFHKEKMFCVAGGEAL